MNKKLILLYYANIINIIYRLNTADMILMKLLLNPNIFSSDSFDDTSRPKGIEALIGGLLNPHNTNACSNDNQDGPANTKTCGGYGV